VTAFELGIGYLIDYPIQTQMMSTTGDQKRTLVAAARRVWQLGGVPAYYRGLTVRRSLLCMRAFIYICVADWAHRRIPVGRSTVSCIFPSDGFMCSYSAIDMSTFEALKLAYLRSTGKDEPGVLALLAFGSVSGSVGATSVYPLNLVRTRLQASGSSGHPQRYTGVWDVTVKTYHHEGWRGFYRGLFPTLAKVSSFYAWMRCVHLKSSPGCSSSIHFLCGL
jgi:solute carrier family 25 phosphate transporter 23/24/25/41